MSKSGYSYAPDEFDQPAPHGAPAGVHRTQRSGWRKTWPFLLVMVLFAGLALGGFYWLNHRPADTPAAQTSSPAAASVAPSDEGSAEQEPPAETTPEESTPEPSPSTSSAVNKAASVRVLNGSNVSGLAGRGAEKLQASGYTAVTSDNYSGEKLSNNTIYYKTPEMEATAADIAAQFGIPVDAEHVQLVPQNKADVSVILVKDFGG